MAKRFVIGDIHGCSKSLKALVGNKLQPTKNDMLFFLGDYIDRGPDSKGVIDYIFQLQYSGYNVKTLMGNHEHFLLQARTNNPLFRSWKRNGGGNKALQSFGVLHPNDLNEKYLHFFETLPSYLVLEDAILVHAGFNCNIENPFNDFITHLYSREVIYNAEVVQHKKIIHGHTPTPFEIIEQQVRSNSVEINLDSGCVYFKREGLGNLTSLELNSWQLYNQPNIDQ